MKARYPTKLTHPEVSWLEAKAGLHSCSHHLPQNSQSQAKITPTEMALVMDLPICHTKQMMESDLLLLIDSVIPEKVVQLAIYFLSAWNLHRKQMLSVKRLLDEAGEENQPLAKQA